MSVFVIAEAGVNHDGSMTRAFALIEAAKQAGADAVKFQLFDAKLLGRQEIAQYELTREQMAHLAEFCKALGIQFMCTPFDVDALHFLAPLVKRMKIASGCLEDEDLLHAARDTMLPIILSTGMSDLPRIENALTFLGHGHPAKYGTRPITLLHCTSSYPCPIEDVNLKAMDVLRWQWGVHQKHDYGGAARLVCDVGYSDHTDGIAVPIAAVALGATVIEKHLTLDRSLPGPDHKASITPREFRAMVMAIHDIEKALGDGVKRPMPSEEPVRKIWRSI